MKNLLIFIMLCHYSITSAQVSNKEAKDFLTQIELQEKIKQLENSLNDLRNEQKQDHFLIEKKLTRKIRKAKAGVVVGSSMMLSGIVLLISGANAEEEKKDILSAFVPSNGDVLQIMGTCIGLTGMGITIKGAVRLKRNKKELRQLASHQVIVNPGTVGYVMTF